MPSLHLTCAHNGITVCVSFLFLTFFLTFFISNMIRVATKMDLPRPYLHDMFFSFCRYTVANQESGY